MSSTENIDETQPRYEEGKTELGIVACLIQDAFVQLSRWTGLEFDTTCYLALSAVTQRPVWSFCLVLLLVALLMLRHQRKRKLPPGPFPFWPFAGHVSYLLTNPQFRLSRLRDVYGDVYQLRCGRTRVVVLNSLEAILEGLEQRGEQLALRPEFESYHALYPGVGRSGGLLTGDLAGKTSVFRQFLTAALDAFCSTASSVEDKVSSEIVDTINHFGGQGQPFDPAPFLDLACLNVSLYLAFSQRFSPAGRVSREILRTYESRSAMLGFRGPDFVRLMKLFTTSDEVDLMQQLTERVKDCYKELINLHKDTYDPENLRDFTDQLLLFVDKGDDSGLLLNDDIDNLLLDIVGYGFQGVAVTLTWILGYMALHQDIQEAVYTELDSIAGRDRLPCLEDQPYLPLTMAVICEAQRMASVRPVLFPHRSSTKVDIQGFEIPADSVVLFNVWGMHHDSRYWPNPSRFDPYRFLSEDRTCLDIPDSFLPYGLGPRQCPGESLADVQLFLFFAALMHQLRFLPHGPARPPLEGVFDCGLVKPKPFLVTVVERDTGIS